MEVDVRHDCSFILFNVTACVIVWRARFSAFRCRRPNALFLYRSIWKQVEGEISNGVLGFKSCTDRDVLKGYMDLAHCCDVQEESFEGEFRGLEDRKLPGFKLVCTKGFEHKFGTSSCEERRQWVECLKQHVARGRDVETDSCDTNPVIIALRKKYATQACKTGGNKSTGGSTACKIHP